MPTRTAPTHTRRGAAVTINALTKRFGPDQAPLAALEAVSLYIPAQQRVAVTGQSGSGKSTLLNLVGAMDRPDAGTITVGDMEVTALRRRQLSTYRRSIGFVFQRFHLLPALTVLDNIIAPVLPRRVDFDRTARARELLAAVGLSDRERALPSQLSAGQQQRVAIARALIARPHLLLADEPTGNLDTKTSQEMIELIDELATGHGITLLVVTHEHDLAAFCERAVELRDGAVVSDTQPEAPSAGSREH